jgi:Ca2+-binding RTX toxin-like protein
MADPILWIDDTSGNVGHIDAVTGAATPVGYTGTVLTDLAFNPQEQLYGSTFSTLYTVNQLNGSLTPVGNFGTGVSINGLVFSASGTLYGSGGTGLYTINTSTGAATLVGNSGLPPGFGSAGDLAFLNGKLYEAVTDGAVSDLTLIDPATGAGQIVGTIVGNPSVLALATGSNGTLYGVDGTKVYSINPSTGIGTLVTSYLNPSLGDAAGAASQFEATAAPPASDLAVLDTTTGQPVLANEQPYSGPVSGLLHEYINITSDSLNISVSTPNWFLHSGSGNDAIAANGGTNVLDGGTGSNFLVGGSGTDTFFVDDRGPTADIWSTVNGFHAGDAATIWGVTPNDFNLNWVDGQGAAGFTGLTLHATATGKPTASLTLAGYTTADLTNGRLSMSFGTDPASGSAYMYVHGNS